MISTFRRWCVWKIISIPLLVVWSWSATTAISWIAQSRAFFASKETGESRSIPVITAPFSNLANEKHLKPSKQARSAPGPRPRLEHPTRHASSHTRSVASLKNWKRESRLLKREKPHSNACWRPRRAISWRLNQLTSSCNRSIESWKKTLIGGRRWRSLLEVINNDLLDGRTHEDSVDGYGLLVATQFRSGFSQGFINRDDFHTSMTLLLVGAAAYCSCSYIALCHPEL